MLNRVMQPDWQLPTVCTKRRGLVQYTNKALIAGLTRFAVSHISYPFKQPRTRLLEGPFAAQVPAIILTGVPVN
jgi:hypothetical protein